MDSMVEHAFIKAELREKIRTLIKQCSCVDGICHDRLTPAEITKAVNEALYEAVRELGK